MSLNIDTIKAGIPLLRTTGLLLVMDTPKGRGVFAGRDIPAQTVLEVSPVLVLDQIENEVHIRKTDLYNYTYNWPYEKEATLNNKNIPQPSTTQAVILGLGSLFNHSLQNQNVGWYRDVPNRLITYKSLRDIKCGEELCISYGDRLTFVDADTKTTTLDDEGIDILNNIDPS